MTHKDLKRLKAGTKLYYCGSSTTNGRERWVVRENVVDEVKVVNLERLYCVSNADGRGGWVDGKRLHYCELSPIKAVWARLAADQALSRRIRRSADREHRKRIRTAAKVRRTAEREAERMLAKLERGR